VDKFSLLSSQDNPKITPTDFLEFPTMAVSKFLEQLKKNLMS
jgi:hypothetical protein